VRYIFYKDSASRVPALTRPTFPTVFDFPKNATDLFIDLEQPRLSSVNVFVLRHGEAGTHVTVPSKDSERPLTESGRDEIESVATSLRNLRVGLDRIVTSPLKRAKETAEIIASAYEGNAPKLEIWEELRPEGSRQDAIQRLSRMRQDMDILLVGHEPFLSSLVGEIISGSSSARITLKKGGVAKIQILSFAPKPSGELRWLLTPRHLKKMAN
jgi:phosphohistidine phosphatase